MPDFDVPPLKLDEAEPGSNDWNILEWADAKLKNGQLFVESAVGYDNIQRALNSIFATENEGKASYVPGTTGLSSTRANLVAKTAEDVTSMLTDTRIFWNYATRNPKYEVQARLSNKIAEDWYNSRMIDLRIADIVRYYCVAGTGVGHLYYSRRLNDMMLDALDPRNVFPIDPISYHTFQDCKGVIIRQARTPDWVKGEYDKTVAPDVGGGGIGAWFTRVIVAATRGKVSGPLTRRKGDDAAIPHTPTVFVNTMYLNDTRTNKKSDSVFMGEWSDDGKPQTTWSYEVKPGAPLYPFKRLIVWCTNTLLYDGPAPYWHAQFPVIKLTLNPWPGSWLGKAPLWDIMPLNTSLNSLLRVIDDHAAQLAQPPVVADRNVSKAELDKFNSRTPGAKIRTNSQSGKGIVVQQVPALDQSLWEHVKWIQEMMKDLSGTADIGAMANLNQIPSNDTIDTIMKAMTPGIRCRSRILEGFMKEFAEQYLYCIAQFVPLEERLAKFGPAGATAEDYDFDPKSFVPDDVPDGGEGDIASMENAFSQVTRPIYSRAKSLFASFTFSYKPGSLLNSAAQQDRMEDFMLAKMGYLSVFTLMENLGKMNFAPSTIQVPNSELERLQLQQQLGVGMIANAQGRKATDAAPPAIQQQGGNVTLATS